MDLKSAFPQRNAGRWEVVITTIIFLISILSFLGCTTVQPSRTPSELTSGPEPRMNLGPGDVLEIKFLTAAELNETQTVRPDGMISLQMLEEVMAQGKTPKELRDELTQLYAPHLKKPVITVIVRSLANRKVYVSGHVNKPGVIDMPMRLTVLEAIMQAGGFDDRRAEVSTVVLIRHKDGKRYGASLDLTPALRGQEFESVYLEPQDIIYVPRSKISQVNQWIDQYINLMIPRTGFSYSTVLGSGATIGFTPPTTVVTQP